MDLARRGRTRAIIGPGLLPVAGLVAFITYGARAMARDSCMGEECHHGQIDFDPWAGRLLMLSALLGFIALLLPARKAGYQPLRVTLVALQLILLPLPTLICGYP
ncbi:hypothetical protein ACZ90_60060 [Streptomyces albus subsp. albus]|nr:hypothetical protein ACZ90_60060 [Streptomyces albus subsp. albus]